MEILNFLLANWDSVILIVSVAIILIVLYKRGRVGIVEKVLFALVSQAEKEFGSGTGELKKATVLQWIYEKLPKQYDAEAVRNRADRKRDRARSAPTYRYGRGTDQCRESDR